MPTGIGPRIAAIEARVSTKGQRDDGTSLETQRAAALAKAAELGYVVPEDFIIMEDWSGTDLARPGLLRLLHLAASGKIHAIIIYDFDRLYRPENLGDEWRVFPVLQQLADAAVEVHWVNQSVPTTGPMGSLFTFLSSWKAGAERRATLERTTRGRIKTAQMGGMLGGFTAFGYVYVPRTKAALGHVEINETQANIVRQMFEWLIREQCSTREIARRLMAAAVPTPQGKRIWHPGVVNHILRQEIYCGTAYFRRHERAAPLKKAAGGGAGKAKKTSRRLRPRAEWIPIPAPMIIDRATWELAQQQLKSNSQFSPRNNKRYEYLCGVGLVRCGLCGKTYAGWTSAKGGRQYSYYTCKQDPLTAPDGRRCAGKAVHARTLETTIWDAVVDLLKNPETLAGELRRRQAAAESPASGLNKRRALQAELKQLAAKADRLLDLYGDGRFDRTAVDAKMDEVNARRKAIESELVGLDRETEAQGRGQRHLANLEAFCKAIAAGLERLSFEERQQLLRLVMTKAIILSNTKVRIEVAIPLNDPDTSSGLRTTHHNEHAA